MMIGELCVIAASSLSFVESGDQSRAKSGSKGCGL